MLATVSQSERSTYSSWEFFKNRMMEAKELILPSVRMVSAPKGGSRYRPSRFRDEVPGLAGAQMVHQRLVVLLGDNAHLVDTGIHHVGQGRSPPGGNGRRRARKPITRFMGQFTHPALHVHRQNKMPITSLLALITSPPPACRIRSWPWAGTTARRGPACMPGAHDGHAPLSSLFSIILGALAHHGVGAHHGILRHNGVLHQWRPPQCGRRA